MIGFMSLAARLSGIGGRPEAEPRLRDIGLSELSFLGEAGPYSLPLNYAVAAGSLPRMSASLDWGLFAVLLAVVVLLCLLAMTLLLGYALYLTLLGSLASLATQGMREIHDGRAFLPGRGGVVNSKKVVVTLVRHQLLPFHSAGDPVEEPEREEGFPLRVPRANTRFRG